MQFKAKAKYIQKSPYKLRPIVDVIRGKSARYALDFLATHANRRTQSIEKVLKSAVANAEHLKSVKPEELIIRDFRVDQGPIFKYFKPGAMGRAQVQRKRFSHLNITLESKEV